MKTDRQAIRPHPVCPFLSGGYAVATLKVKKKIFKKRQVQNYILIGQLFINKLYNTVYIEKLYIIY